MRVRSPAVALALVFALQTGLLVRTARAADASAENGALASALFEEGRKLMEQGRVPEACQKFEESERLDPGGGTLLNLAACHEREGRTASAWTEFGEALAQARRDGREDRARVALQRIAALEPKLPRVTITVPAASDQADLEVTLDGTPVRRPAWGLGVPVDAGDHTVEAKAPGAAAWRTTLTVHASGESQNVAIPALEALPPLGPGIVATAPEPQPTTSAPLVSEAPHAPGVPLWRDATMVASATVGVAGLALGSYFGLHAIALNRDAGGECPAGRCTNGAATTSDRATSSADASTVAFGVGAAGVVAAVVMLITRPAHAGSGAMTASVTTHAALLGWRLPF